MRVSLTIVVSKVLQLGIMIHSLVIGLTLSITSGPEFSEWRYVSLAVCAV